MNPKLEEALLDLAISIVKGLKVFVVYIFPSVVVAVLLSSEFRDLINSHPSLAVYTPLINTVVIVVADLIKKRMPDSGVAKIL